jgi:hypothetical protein
MVLSFIFTILSIITPTHSISVSMFPKTGSPPRSRELPGFVMHTDYNKLYIYGGRAPDTLGDMWEYDLEENKWNEIYMLSINPGPRSEPFLLPLPNGNILLFGGITISGPISDMWEYDIENNIVVFI